MDFIELNQLNKSIQIIDQEVTAIKSELAAQSNASHQYGEKFEWRYNPTTGSLDLVVLE